MLILTKSSFDSERCRFLRFITEAQLINGLDAEHVCLSFGQTAHHKSKGKVIKCKICNFSFFFFYYYLIKEIRFRSTVCLCLNMNLLGFLVGFMISWCPVFRPSHTLVNVIPNQVVGVLWRSPLDEDRGVCFSCCNNLTRSRRYTCGEQKQREKKRLRPILKMNHLTCKKSEAGGRQTFELKSLNQFSWLWWLAGPMHVGRQNSEFVFFSFRQVKDGITGRSNGHLGVNTLPCIAAWHELWRYRLN